MSTTSGTAQHSGVNTAHEPRECDGALRVAFDLLGKRWNGPILGTLRGGAVGYAELQRAIAGISPSVLSDRLTELTAAGLVTRDVANGPPVSVSYHLTASGEALQPALDELATWAREHLSKCPAPKDD